jgi:hypothetical protein
LLPRCEARRFYVKDRVAVRVQFGRGFGVLESSPLSLDGARLDAPRRSSVGGDDPPLGGARSRSFGDPSGMDAPPLSTQVRGFGVAAAVAREWS